MTFDLVPSTETGYIQAVFWLTLGFLGSWAAVDLFILKIVWPLRAIFKIGPEEAAALGRWLKKQGETQLRIERAEAAGVE